MRYHLGCGEQRLDGWTNVDIRETPATDLVTDLTHPRLQDAAACFSNAFFEHLRRNDRVPHLRALYDALTPEGFVCYLGLPDFRAVARLYLEGGPGIVGPRFDLFNAYRATHGDPEMRGDDEAGYFGQLHKSLFDTEEVDQLLGEAGFPSHVAFGYVFPGEPAPVTMGFYATKQPRPVQELRDAARTFLSAFDGRYLELDTLTFTGEASRSAAHARILASPWRRAARRVARGLASYLARI